MTSAPFVRAKGVNLLRRLRALLIPAVPPPPAGAPPERAPPLRAPPLRAPPFRALAARRALDRLLLLATAASLLAAVLERRAPDGCDGPSGSGHGGSGPSGIGNGVAPSLISSFPVNLASDPPERLRLLPGLGPTRLAALLREREQNGAPSSWDDLEQIPGIGAKTLSAWRASGATIGESGRPARRTPETTRARDPPGTHAR